MYNYLKIKCLIKKNGDPEKSGREWNDRRLQVGVTQLYSSAVKCARSLGATHAGGHSAVKGPCGMPEGTRVAAVTLSVLPSVLELGANGVDGSSSL